MSRKERSVSRTETRVVRKVKHLEEESEVVLAAAPARQAQDGRERLVVDREQLHVRRCFHLGCMRACERERWRESERESVCEGERGRERVCVCKREKARVCV